MYCLLTFLDLRVGVVAFELSIRNSSQRINAGRPPVSKHVHVCKIYMYTYVVALGYVQ